MFHNPHLAIWITAIIFSAIHLQFYGFIPRMLLGALLGYLFYWSGNLWLSILAHFVNNGFAVVVAYLINSNIISEDAETIGAGDHSIIIGMSSLMLSSGLLFLVWKNEQRSNA